MSKQNSKISGYDTTGEYIIAEELYRDSFEVDTVHLNLRRGFKNYELTNHLGNVHATIPDLRIPSKNPSDTTQISYYKLHFSSATDYYPFGMMMSFGDSVGYGFGFQGQMRDDDISGQGNSYTAEFWQYDSRLGRRWNVDPVVKPWESSYACFWNNPVWLIDPNGADTTVYIYTTQNSINVFDEDGNIEVKREDVLSPDQLEEVKNNVRNIFEKNGITNLKYQIITQEEALALELDDTDAIISIIDGNKKRGNTSYKRHSNYYLIKENTYANWYHFRDKYGDGLYQLSYVAAHEVLHQFLIRAELFHFGKVSLGHHDDSYPNLNMDGEKLNDYGGSPLFPSKELQYEERIFFYQKRMIHYFFKKYYRNAK